MNLIGRWSTPFLNSLLGFAAGVVRHSEPAFAGEESFGRTFRLFYAGQLNTATKSHPCSGQKIHSYNNHHAGHGTATGAPFQKLSEKEYQSTNAEFSVRSASNLNTDFRRCQKRGAGLRSSIDVTCK
jgi:hypothetical protein